MSEDSRVKRWRDAKKQHGLKALTIWLTEAEELRLKDLAMQWHSSPSEVMQHALALVGTTTAQDISNPTDTYLTRQRFQEEIAALQETVDTLQATLPTLVQQIVREEMAALPVLSAPDAVGITVGPTDTDAPAVPATEGVTVSPTDTVALAYQLATDQASVTDIPTDTYTDTPAEIPTDYPTDTAAPSTPARRKGRRPVMRERILALLAEHPEGLSAQALRVHLDLEPGQEIGNTLQGMRRSEVVRTQGQGQGMRYRLP